MFGRGTPVSVPARFFPVTVIVAVRSKTVSVKLIPVVKAVELRWITKFLTAFFNSIVTLLDVIVFVVFASDNL